MAVTKTHPIKSTLKAAIDYILNPEKTDGKLLASSFGCGLETADIEFAWTREAAGDRGTHLGRHLIQSFAVGETTPEEAHKIGMELAGAVLGGKYEFVLTTHVDKDHLHNHLIFNAVMQSVLYGVGQGLLLFGRQLVKYGGLLLLQKLRHLLKTDTVYIVGGVLVVLMKHNNVGNGKAMPLKVGGVVDIKPFPNVAQRHILC